MAVWNGGDFKEARVIGVPVGGGKASAAIVIGSTPPAIKFKRNRASTWPDDADAKAVGDLGSSTVKKIDLLQVPSRLIFIITNGLDVHFISENDGESWSPLATL